MPAIKDIQEGEEMVGDYDCIKYPKGIWIDKLYEELDPERYQLTEKKSQWMIRFIVKCLDDI